MPERILAQCNVADFKAIEHLVDVYGTEDFDQTPLSKKQILALGLVTGFVSVGLTFKDCFSIREVLFWDNHIEFRFFPGEESQNLKLKLSDKTMSDAIQNKFAAVLEGNK